MRSPRRHPESVSALNRHPARRVASAHDHGGLSADHHLRAPAHDHLGAAADHHLRPPAHDHLGTAADEDKLIMFLEPDQLVCDKSRRLPRAPLTRKAAAALWALRIFVLVVSAMVIYTFVVSLGS